jgi:hypothetical protein
MPLKFWWGSHLAIYGIVMHVTDAHGLEVASYPLSSLMFLKYSDVWKYSYTSKMLSCF